MKLRYTLFALLSTVLYGSALMAQSPEWYEMMQDPNANFKETVRKAEAYFARVGTGKGTGWKQFKRWEYYMETRVAEDGSQSLPLRTSEEVQRYRDSHPELYNQRRNSISGNWNELGPIQMPSNGTGQPNGLGRVTAIEFHPTDVNTALVGSASGGIWRTTDYGATWTEVSTGLQYLSVSSFKYHPVTPNIVYAATGDRDGGDAPGRGVWRSTDGGTTWTAHNTGMGNRVCYEILMHPSNPDIMIVSTNGNIWRTTNGGTNWTNVYTGGENFKDLAFHPGNPNIVYASGNDYYRSADNGVTWTHITSGVPAGTQRMALGVSPAQPNTVYLLAGDGAGFDGLYRSTDSGLNFVQRSNAPNICGYDVTGGTGSQAWYDLVLNVDQADVNHLWAGAINIWESLDGGTSWSISAHWVGSGGNPAVHADQHVLEWNPHTGHLWNGNDGGVYYTSDGGASWPEISSGLAIAQVYKIGQSQTVKDLVINGYQDNGTGIYRGLGGWWTEIGGDGMECIIDPLDETYMYGALYYGSIRRSTNGGLSFGGIVGGIAESGAWITPYKVVESTPDTMLVGMNNVWRSFDAKSGGTPTWTQISSLGGGSTIRDIGIAPSDPNVVYITRSGTTNFYRSNNAMGASPTWTNLDAGLPTTGMPSDIEIDPTDPTHLWITLGNDVYESTNSGASWTNYAGTLPNIPANTIVYDRRSVNDALYVGMDIGVYYRDNTMPDWVPFDAGIPNVEVTELEIYYDQDCPGNDMIRAATYGRGLWETDLRDPGNVPPIACFAATPTEVCEGMTVVLEDQSAYTPTSWSWSITPATHAYVNGTSASDQNPEVQFNAVGLYTITLTSTNGNGSDVVTRTDYINVTGSALGLPITEDWESAALCGTGSDCGATVCGLVNGWTNLVNGVEDNIDWRVDEGGTPSGGTGPSIDANPGTATGNYVYTEASSCFNNTALMISPCIDLRTATNPELTFGYHMLGTNMGELHVDIFINGAWVNDIMPVISGDQGSAWLFRTVALSPYVGNVVILRFRGITGPGFASDIALDDIQITDSPVLDGTDLAFAGERLPEQGNLLTWEGDVSPQVESFVLERRLRSGDFAELSRVPVAQGKDAYDYLDRQPMSGLNVYRLRTLDANGQITEAGLVQILVQDGAKFTAYPNPYENQLNVSIDADASGKGVLRMVDVLGKVVFEQELDLQKGYQEMQFDLGQLDAGIYFLRYQDQTIRVVKL